MKVKNCPKCGSFNFIKKGFDNKKQRYFCKDCNSYFQPKIELPSWVKKAYRDYTFGNMIYKDLKIKYNKSIPTLTKYFDNLGNIKTNVDIVKLHPIEKSINLIFDATFLKI